MLRVFMLTFVITIAAVVFIGAASSERENSARGRLPGARPEIEAAQFPSLQEAIDALPEQGGIVRLPSGHFKVAAPLVVHSGDVTLQGAGTTTLIENVNQDGQPALILAHPKNAENRKNELWRVRLADFRLIGNPRSGDGVLAKHVNEIMIDGVTISYHGGHGVHLDHCYEDPRICDCLITYNKKTGVQLEGCHDIVVSACQFEENDDALQCLDSFNLTMTGNNVDDHLGRGVVIENTYGSVVASNMIEECAHAAIVLDRDCYGITLSANVIAHNGAGIDLRDAHGCCVSANTMTLMQTDAVRIGPNSDRIAVTGNSFCNSYIGAGQVKRNTEDSNAAGLVLNDTHDIAIVGNQFSSVRPKALAVEGERVRKVLFSNNVLTDVQTDQEKLDQSRVVNNLESDGP